MLTLSLYKPFQTNTTKLLNPEPRNHHREQAPSALIPTRVWSISNTTLAMSLAYSFPARVTSLWAASGIARMLLVPITPLPLHLCRPLVDTRRIHWSLPLAANWWYLCNMNALRRRRRRRLRATALTMRHSVVALCVPEPRPVRAT